MSIQLPNFTLIENSIFDYWLPILSDSELGVLLFFAYKQSFFFDASKDEVKEICIKSNLIESEVNDSINSLEVKGIIQKKKGVTK